MVYNLSDGSTNRNDDSIIDDKYNNTMVGP